MNWEFSAAAALMIAYALVCLRRDLPYGKSLCSRQPREGMEP